MRRATGRPERVRRRHAGTGICESFEHHLHDCNPCQIVVDNIRKTITLYKGAAYELPPELHQRLCECLREPLETEVSRSPDLDRPTHWCQPAGDAGRPPGAYRNRLYADTRQKEENHAVAGDSVDRWLSRGVVRAEPLGPAAVRCGDVNVGFLRGGSAPDHEPRGFSREPRTSRYST